MKFTIKDPTFVNVGNFGPLTTPALVPNRVITQDIPNSTGGVHAIKPAGITDIPLGVLSTERVAIDSVSGVVLDSQPLPVAMYGHVDIEVASAVAVGDVVAVADANGRIATAVRSAAGAQLKPVVGQALTGATAAGQTVEVALAYLASF